MMKNCFGRGSRRRLYMLAGAAVWVALAQPAKAVDEIQVYNAGIAAPGQFTIQQHLNYIPLGVKDPPFPGGLVSHNSINGTPEFAYGVTDWWEVGLYLPFAIQDRQFLSDSFKLRTLFVSPNAAERNFFYGVNFEFSNTTPKFSQTRFGLEIRPILGVRNADYEFIVNPIVDIGFGKYGEATFTPAARLARKLGPDLFVGLEYYADFGEIGNFLKPADQQHTLFAVTDFKLGDFGVNFGVGYGLTPASDRWVVKTIVGYAFPVPGSNPGASERATASPPALSIRCRAPPRASPNPDETTRCFASHARFARIRSNNPANIVGEPRDRSFAIRRHREGVPLAHRGASARAISDRLVDAGYSPGHETRRRHDISCLLRNRHPDTYRFALRVAACSSGGAREFASPMAAAGLGSHALAALCAGIGPDTNRLAVRVLLRLVG